MVDEGGGLEGWGVFGKRAEGGLMDCQEVERFGDVCPTTYRREGDGRGCWLHAEAVQGCTNWKKNRRMQYESRASNMRLRKKGIRRAAR